MNVLGQKLKNTSILGAKLKNAQLVGKKLSSRAASDAIQGAAKGKKLIGRAGRAIDVGARQVSNTSGVVDRSLGRLNPYLSGTVLEGVNRHSRPCKRGSSVS